MAQLVHRGRPTEKVKLTLTKMGKITRSETRRKKERTVTKKSIIFPAKHNPREQSIKAVIKKYEHILQKKEI